MYLISIMLNLIVLLHKVYHFIKKDKIFAVCFTTQNLPVKLFLSDLVVSFRSEPFDICRHFCFIVYIE